MNWKKLLLAVSIITIFSLIILLTYFQIIIWNEGMIIAVIIISLIGAVVVGLWYFLSKKKPLKLGKDMSMKEARELANKHADEEMDLYFDMPPSKYCYWEERFDKENRYFGFAGLGKIRNKTSETNPNKILQDPRTMLITGRLIIIINATERRVVDAYTKPNYNEYENIWKRLGIVSASRNPEKITKVVKETPLGRTEEMTAPIGSPELESKEELP